MFNCFKLIVLSLFLSVPSYAAIVAEVASVQGAASAQSKGGGLKLIGKGSVLNEGDEIITAPNSHAVLKFNDGGQITVRPDTRMKIDSFAFGQAGREDSMVLGLFKGGLRAVTGLISKQSATAAKIQTNSATIGIRGTDFDARLCTGDCEQEAKQAPTQQNKTVEVAAAARVVSLSGKASVKNKDSNLRMLVQGGAVYVGERVETATDGTLVLAFRDGGKVSLRSDTQMQIDRFEYKSEAASEGSFGVSLFKGGLRALTGLIGKARPEAVQYKTKSATIGIRGTGVDFECTAACADPNVQAMDGFGAYVWEGHITITPVNGPSQQLNLGDTILIRTSGILRPASPPASLGNMPAPRPDTIPVDLQLLFGQSDVNNDAQGLYVHVRDGNVSLTDNTSQQILYLGKDETGFTNKNNPVRLRDLPVFIEFDRTPIGIVKVPLRELLSKNGIPSNLGCKPGTAK
ncbi:FecR domain-containing protein [Iodobacter sp.]|uniref:FecR family protein n=1 Tax=Iodobacter sp. TaxID=1915058 RepID=UPI0025F2C911|nr:FecR domain-containing protein [Iodobacter sp.]